MIITEKRYQEAIRDRMIVEMIKKICSEDRGYMLQEMAVALLDASDECRIYEAEVETCLKLGSEDDDK